MRRKPQIPDCVILCLLVGLSLSSCLELPAKGGDGEPCFENGGCTEGLQCLEGTCRGTTEDAGGKPGDGGSDRETNVVYPDAGDGKDAGRKDAGGGKDTGPSDRGTTDDGTMDDGGPADAETPDDGTVDAGEPSDRGTTDDGTTDDGGLSDGGAADAGAEDVGTADAGDPCAEYICLCDSYCTVSGGIPKCVAGCATAADCCSAKSCSGGKCN
ncbi:MAG: hypothetical protein HY897_11115 [Deltaproteobacteria bacterium]|nr:hypothetical protein [Deltaproteobacteria bacterium]